MTILYTEINFCVDKWKKAWYIYGELESSFVKNDDKHVTLGRSVCFFRLKFWSTEA